MKESRPNICICPLSERLSIADIQTGARVAAARWLWWSHGLLIDPCPFDEQFTFNQVLEASAWIFWKKFNTFGRVDGAERSVGELNEMQIEGLILNEFDIQGYRSIALWMIYRTSFELELIWRADWS